MLPSNGRDEYWSPSTNGEISFYHHPVMDIKFGHHQMIEDDFWSPSNGGDDF